MADMTYTDPNTKDLQPGDIITGYHKGFWRVLKVTRRYMSADDVPSYSRALGKTCKVGDEYGAIIRMDLVLDASFKPAGKKPKQVECDVAYCVKIDSAWVASERAKINSNLDRLQGVLP